MVQVRSGWGMYRGRMDKRSARVRHHEMTPGGTRRVPVGDGNHHDAVHLTSVCLAHVA